MLPTIKNKEGRTFHNTKRQDQGFSRNEDVLVLLRISQSFVGLWMRSRSTSRETANISTDSIGEHRVTTMQRPHVECMLVWGKSR
jgi:hypothetical protein